MKCNYNGCSSKCKGDIDVESCNVLRAYNQGVREFAKWICDGVTPKSNPFVNWMALETLRDGSCYGIEVEELLAEWQKGNQ